MERSVTTGLDYYYWPCQGGTLISHLFNVYMSYVYLTSWCMIGGMCVCVCVWVCFARELGVCFLVTYPAWAFSYLLKLRKCTVIILFFDRREKVLRSSYSTLLKYWPSVIQLNFGLDAEFLWRYIRIQDVCIMEHWLWLTG